MEDTQKTEVEYVAIGREVIRRQTWYPTASQWHAIGPTVRVSTIGTWKTAEGARYRASVLNKEAR